MSRKKAGRYDPKKGSKKLKDLLVEIDDTIKAGGDPVKAAEQLEKGKLSNKLKFTPKDGAYHITEKEKSNFLTFIRDKLKINGESRTGITTDVVVDGNPGIMRNGGNKTKPQWRINSRAAKNKENIARLQSLQISPGKQPQSEIDMLKQRKADMDRMKMWAPEEGYFDEHIMKAGNFDKMSEGQGLAHLSNDTPNVRINNKKWGDLKTKAEALGDSYGSWFVDAVDDELVFINRSMHDAQFPKKAGIAFDGSDIAAHKKFLETGSLKGVTSKNKKFINYALSERAPYTLPLDKQRDVFLQSVAKDKGVSKTLRNKVAKLVGLGTAVTGLGILGDGYDAIAGTKAFLNKGNSKLKTAADGLQAMSGALGLASLKIPPALIPSLGAKGAELHIRNRIDQQKNRYKTASDRLTSMPTDLKIRKTNEWDQVQYGTL
tara:strand:+ start:90 stop:1385 length:1296 start_codon:yes stop_codon:yes gene_type:complete